MLLCKTFLDPKQVIIDDIVINRRVYLLSLFTEISLNSEGDGSTENFLLCMFLQSIKGDLE